jgi:hypothetical protein
MGMEGGRTGRGENGVLGKQKDRSDAGMWLPSNSLHIL